MGAERDDRIYGETPVALYRTLTEEGPTFHISVHDEVVAQAQAGRLKGVELQIELAHFSPADEVIVRLDGKLLGEPVVRNVAAEDPDDPSDVSENSWLTWSLKPQEVDRGTHTVQIILGQRDPRIRPPLVVQHVEVWVQYRKD